MKKLDSVNVALPNTVEEKMDAIVAISHAIENVSRALISVNVEVLIKDNIIQTKNSKSIGINIDTK